MCVKLYVLCACLKIMSVHLGRVRRGMQAGTWQHFGSTCAGNYELLMYWRGLMMYQSAHHTAQAWGKIKPDKDLEFRWQQTELDAMYDRIETLCLGAKQVSSF